MVLTNNKYINDSIQEKIIDYTENAIDITQKNVAYNDNQFKIFKYNTDNIFRNFINFYVKLLDNKIRNINLDTKFNEFILNELINIDIQIRNIYLEHKLYNDIIIENLSKSININNLNMFEYNLENVYKTNFELLSYNFKNNLLQDLSNLILSIKNNTSISNNITIQELESLKNILYSKANDVYINNQKYIKKNIELENKIQLNEINNKIETNYIYLLDQNINFNLNTLKSDNYYYNIDKIKVKILDTSFNSLQFLISEEFNNIDNIKNYFKKIELTQLTELPNFESLIAYDKTTTNVLDNLIKINSNNDTLQFIKENILIDNYDFYSINIFEEVVDSIFNNGEFYMITILSNENIEYNIIKKYIASNPDPFFSNVENLNIKYYNILYNDNIIDFNKNIIDDGILVCNIKNDKDNKYIVEYNNFTPFYIMKGDIVTIKNLQNSNIIFDETIEYVIKKVNNDETYILGKSANDFNSNINISLPCNTKNTFTFKRKLHNINLIDEYVLTCNLTYINEYSKVKIKVIDEDSANNLLPVDFDYDKYYYLSNVHNHKSNLLTYFSISYDLEETETDSRHIKFSNVFINENLNKVIKIEYINETDSLNFIDKNGKFEINKLAEINYYKYNLYDSSLDYYVKNSNDNLDNLDNFCIELNNNNIIKATKNNDKIYVEYAILKEFFNFIDINDNNNLLDYNSNNLNSTNEYYLVSSNKDFDIIYTKILDNSQSVFKIKYLDTDLTFNKYRYNVIEKISDENYIEVSNNDLTINYEYLLYNKIQKNINWIKLINFNENIITYVLDYEDNNNINYKNININDVIIKKLNITEIDNCYRNNTFINLNQDTYIIFNNNIKYSKYIENSNKFYFNMPFLFKMKILRQIFYSFSISLSQIYSKIQLEYITDIGKNLKERINNIFDDNINNTRTKNITTNEEVFNQTYNNRINQTLYRKYFSNFDSSNIEIKFLNTKNILTLKMNKTTLDSIKINIKTYDEYNYNKLLLPRSDENTSEIEYQEEGGKHEEKINFAIILQLIFEKRANSNIKNAFHKNNYGLCVFSILNIEYECFNMESFNINNDEYEFNFKCRKITNNFYNLNNSLKLSTLLEKNEQIIKSNNIKFYVILPESEPFFYCLVARYVAIIIVTGLIAIWQTGGSFVAVAASLITNILFAVIFDIVDFANNRNEALEEFQNMKQVTEEYQSLKQKTPSDGVKNIKDKYDQEKDDNNVFESQAVMLTAAVAGNIIDYSEVINFAYSERDSAGDSTSFEEVKGTELSSKQKIDNIKANFLYDNMDVINLITREESYISDRRDTGRPGVTFKEVYFDNDNQLTETITGFIGELSTQYSIIGSSKAVFKGYTISAKNRFKNLGVSKSMIKSFKTDGTRVIKVASKVKNSSKNLLSSLNSNSSKSKVALSDSTRQFLAQNLAKKNEVFVKTGSRPMTIVTKDLVGFNKVGKALFGIKTKLIKGIKSLISAFKNPKKILFGLALVVLEILCLEAVDYFLYSKDICTKPPSIFALFWYIGFPDKSKITDLPKLGVSFNGYYDQPFLLKAGTQYLVFYNKLALGSNDLRYIMATKYSQIQTNNLNIIGETYIYILINPDKTINLIIFKYSSPIMYLEPFELSRSEEGLDLNFTILHYDTNNVKQSQVINSYFNVDHIFDINNNPIFSGSRNKIILKLECLFQINKDLQHYININKTLFTNSIMTKCNQFYVLNDIEYNNIKSKNKQVFTFMYDFNANSMLTNKDYYFSFITNANIEKSIIYKDVNIYDNFISNDSATNQFLWSNNTSTFTDYLRDIKKNEKFNFPINTEYDILIDDNNYYDNFIKNRSSTFYFYSYYPTYYLTQNEIPFSFPSIYNKIQLYYYTNSTDYQPTLTVKFYNNRKSNNILYITSQKYFLMTQNNTDREHFIDDRYHNFTTFGSLVEYNYHTNLFTDYNPFCKNLSHSDNSPVADGEYIRFKVLQKLSKLELLMLLPGVNDYLSGYLLLYNNTYYIALYEIEDISDTPTFNKYYYNINKNNFNTDIPLFNLILTYNILIPRIKNNFINYTDINSISIISFFPFAIFRLNGLMLSNDYIFINFENGNCINIIRSIFGNNVINLNNIDTNRTVPYVFFYIDNDSQMHFIFFYNFFGLRATLEYNIDVKYFQLNSDFTLTEITNFNDVYKSKYIICEVVHIFDNYTLRSLNSLFRYGFICKFLFDSEYIYLTCFFNVRDFEGYLTTEYLDPVNYYNSEIAGQYLKVVKNLNSLIIVPNITNHGISILSNNKEIYNTMTSTYLLNEYLTNNVHLLKFNKESKNCNFGISANDYLNFNDIISLNIIPLGYWNIIKNREIMKPVLDSVHTYIINDTNLLLFNYDNNGEYTNNMAYYLTNRNTIEISIDDYSNESEIYIFKYSGNPKVERYLFNSFGNYENFIKYIYDLLIINSIELSNIKIFLQVVRSLINIRKMFVIDNNNGKILKTPNFQNNLYNYCNNVINVLDKIQLNTKISQNELISSFSNYMYILEFEKVIYTKLFHNLKTNMNININDLNRLDLSDSIQKRHSFFYSNLPEIQNFSVLKNNFVYELNTFDKKLIDNTIDNKYYLMFIKRFNENLKTNKINYNIIRILRENDNNIYIKNDILHHLLNYKVFINDSRIVNTEYVINKIYIMPLRLFILTEFNLIFQDIIKIYLSQIYNIPFSDNDILFSITENNLYINNYLVLSIIDDIFIKKQKTNDQILLTYRNYLFDIDFLEITTIVGFKKLSNFLNLNMSLDSFKTELDNKITYISKENASNLLDFIEKSILTYSLIIHFMFRFNNEKLYEIFYNKIVEIDNNINLLKNMINPNLIKIDNLQYKRSVYKNFLTENFNVSKSSYETITENSIYNIDFKNTYHKSRREKSEKFLVNLKSNLQNQNLIIIINRYYNDNNYQKNIKYICTNSFGSILENKQNIYMLNNNLLENYDRVINDFNLKQYILDNNFTTNVDLKFTIKNSSSLEIFEPLSLFDLRYQIKIEVFSTLDNFEIKSLNLSQLFSDIVSENDDFCTNLNNRSDAFIKIYNEALNYRNMSFISLSILTYFENIRSYYNYVSKNSTKIEDILLLSADRSLFNPSSNQAAVIKRYILIAKKANLLYDNYTNFYYRILLITKEYIFFEKFSFYKSWFNNYKNKIIKMFTQINGLGI